MGRGWGVISFGGKEKALSSDCVAAPEHSKLAAKEPSASLIQSCGLERLVDIPSLAPDGLGDLSGAHSFLAQRHDARAVESDGTTFVDAFRFRSVDASALTIADEAELSSLLPSREPTETV